MRCNRKYYIDGYRNISDLCNKVKAKFAYDNIVITGYDACILLLSDLYHSLPQTVLPKLPKVNLETLVDCLAVYKYGLEDILGNYDRLYHTYSLIYSGYMHATAADANVAIQVLQSIVTYYFQEAPMNNLISLYKFVNYDKPLSSQQCIDLRENRLYIADELNVSKIPIVDY